MNHCTSFVSLMFPRAFKMLKSAKMENESNTAQLNLDLENAKNQVVQKLRFSLLHQK